jgi:hypothetical protein
MLATGPQHENTMQQKDKKTLSFFIVKTPALDFVCPGRFLLPLLTLHLNSTSAVYALAGEI